MASYLSPSPSGSSYDYLDTSRSPTQPPSSQYPLSPSSSRFDPCYYSPLSPQMSQADDSKIEPSSLMVRQGSDYLSPRSPLSPSFNYPSPGGYSGISEGGSPATYSDMAADDYALASLETCSTSYSSQNGVEDYTDDGYDRSPMDDEYG